MNQSGSLQEMRGVLGVQRQEDCGFSLIELMVVVAITAILAAVAIPAYFNHTMRSRQTAVIGELMSIKAAQERFFAEKGGYAPKMNTADFEYATAETYTKGYYQYWITANTSGLVTSGAITVNAKGDLNSDGNFNDRWQLAIDDPSAQPQHDDSGTNEGFSWSSLGNLFK